MKHIDPNDPKWTAYVLDELDDLERARVEHELNSSEEARTLVEELQFAAELTRSEFARAMTAEPLTPQQRKEIVSATAWRQRNWSWRPTIWATGLAMAGFAIIALTLNIRSGLRRERVERTPASAVIAEMKRTEPAKTPQPINPPKPVKEPEVLFEREITSLPPSTVGPTFATAASPKSESADNAVADAKSEKKPALVSQPAAVAEEVQAQPTPPAVNAPPVLGGVRGGVLRADGAGFVTVPVPLDPQGRKAEKSAADNSSNAQENQDQTNFETATSSTLTKSFDPLRAVGGTRNIDRAGVSLSKSVSTSNGPLDNPFLAVTQNPTSTFSVVVDSASYSMVRDDLNRNTLPSRDSVRIEEMINFFTYAYPTPSDSNPIGAAIEAASSPWTPRHRLVRIGIVARSAARNVDIQVAFNPTAVDSYRLIGYESGFLRGENLKHTVVGSGNISANHSVTALYEIIPTPKGGAAETLAVNISYDEGFSTERKSLVFPFADHGQTFRTATVDFRFAAAVAAFGLVLRNSPYKGTATLDSALRIAEDSLGPDPNGLRREFLQLLRQARRIGG